MEQWQFLIQKQGDRSWRNLESPNLKISAGWYRVLARSHLPNTDVEIRISHSLNPEVPGTREIEKRSRRTNPEGLIPIIPFTHLKPGLWELQCSGYVTSDLYSQSWEYGICLDVFSQESSPLSPTAPNQENRDATADHHLPSTAPESPPHLKIHPQPRDFSTSPVDVKGETVAQIVQHLIDLALPVSETLLEDEQVAEIKPPTPLSLTLDRENHIAHWGEIVVIHGRVESGSEFSQPDETPYSAILYGLELVIELRSPLSSQILSQIRQPLPNSLLPITISSAIDIPVDCPSQLILAEINLYGSFTELGAVQLLATQSFTITADISQLLAITQASQLTKQNLLDQSPAPALETDPPIRIDLGLFNLVKTIQTTHYPAIKISPNKSLPPQLNPKKLAAARRLSELHQLADSPVPQLPKLPDNPKTQPPSVSETVAIVDSEENPIEKNNTLRPINLGKLLIKHHPLQMLKSSFPYLKPLKALPAKTEEPENQTSDMLSPPAFEDSPQIETPELQSDEAELENELVTEESSPEEAELNQEDYLYSSPLIRKWMQSQGYSLPESMIEALNQESIPDEQMLLLSPSEESEEIDSSPNLEEETDTATEEILFVADTTETPSAASTEEIAEINTLEEVETGNILEEITIDTSEFDLPPALVEHPTTSPDWLAQEFVVEDTYDIYIAPCAEGGIDNHSSGLQEESVSDLSHTPLLPAAIAEPLPVPHLYVPDGELIAGSNIRVKVELPVISPEIVVKLWMKDFQTRWLLDGPHLLAELLPNSMGNLEVIAQLNIPFGCVEILVEAIAYHPTTQQESHKVTVVRNVIPPNLPQLQLDELLGI
jgi:hypothetical protein